MNNFNPMQYARKPSKQTDDTRQFSQQSIVNPLQGFPEEEQNFEVDSLEGKKEKDSFDPLSYKRTPDEDWLQWGLRNTARPIVRASEALFGSPGDLKQFLGDMAISSYEKATLGKTPDVEKGLIQESGKQREAPDWLKSIVGQSPDIQPDLPTSQDLRKFTGKVSEDLGAPGFLDPKTHFEGVVDDIASDFGSMYFPLGAGKNWLQKLGISTVSNLGSEAVGLWGADDKQKTQAKMGLQLMLDLATRSRPREHATNLLNEAENLIPRNEMIDAQQLYRDLNRQETEIMRGGIAPSDRPALERIRELRGRINPQTMRVDASELPIMNRKMNEVRGNLGGFELPVRDRPAAITQLNKVQTPLHNQITRYGQQNNPEFLELWRRGNEAYGTWAQSNVVSNYISNNYTKPFVSDGAKLLFYGTANTGIGTTVAGVVGAAMVPYKVSQIGYRVYKSPELRRYYASVIRDATIGNSASMIKNLSILDKKLAEQEERDSR